MADRTEPWGKNVLVEFEDRIAWVTLNRPEKRNAMSPAFNDEMVQVLEAVEIDDALRRDGADRRGQFILRRHGSARIFPRRSTGRPTSSSSPAGARPGGGSGST